MKKKSDCKNEAPIIYYDDLLTDEFSETVIEPKKIDGNYQYIRDGIFKRSLSFLGYYTVAMPLAYMYAKAKFSHKVICREKLKNQKGAFFLYGNHTQDTGDAVMPALLCRPKKTYVIVHANNVSMPYLGRITPYLGAIPLPDDMAAMRGFLKAIEFRVSQGSPVVIYPEAHIWPYYTGIRPFPDTSFQYPVKFDIPVYCFTNTYVVEKGRKVKMVTYIDGPFYPDRSLNAAERRKKLRNAVFETMTDRAKSSNAEVIRYEKRRS